MCRLRKSIVGEVFSALRIIYLFAAAVAIQTYINHELRAPKSSKSFFSSFTELACGLPLKVCGHTQPPKRKLTAVHGETKESSSSGLHSTNILVVLLEIQETTV